VFRQSSADVKGSPRSVTPDHAQIRKSYTHDSRDIFTSSVRSTDSMEFAVNVQRVATPDSIESGGFTTTESSEPNLADIVAKENLPTLVADIVAKENLPTLDKNEKGSESSRGSTPSMGHRSMTPVELLSSHTAIGVSEELGGKKAVVKKVFETLVGRTVDYCFRILDQCERSNYFQHFISPY